VFIDEGVEKNGRVMFRCHVEETQQWTALEIPDWMWVANSQLQRFLAILAHRFFHEKLMNTISSAQKIGRESDQ
jgi:hypothetical protein